MIQERCCNKKVLLVLDDVNDVKQLEFLAATREWFGPGSRIIITTRDQHVLSYANANDKYILALLRTDQALELFCRHAFRKSSPPDGYMDLSNRAINYTHHLPLALKVLGSFLCGREASVWGSALDTLAKTPSGEVLDTLKLSFDYLNDSEKQIFLDIACFYKGRDVDEVIRILDSFGVEPVIGISVLIEKSLITISSKNELDMHDLIQEMGWKVVHESAPNSRLWQGEKIHDLINNKKELEFIEGIVVPRHQSVSVNSFKRMKNLLVLNCYGKFTCSKPTFLPDELKQRLSADVFKSMKNLRLLHCEGKFTYNEPTFLPDELRWFCWEFYPFSSLPVAHMSKLVGLEMEWGKIRHLWKGKKIMLQNLKFIRLGLCQSLIRFPDVSGAPNIESLDLSHCYNIVEVDESVGSLKKLVKLNMRWCYKLKCLPSMLHMESLETLILKSCESLKRIPEFSPCMVNLSHLDFSWCPKIKEVPSSIKYLSNLTYLNLCGGKSLENIPNSICELKCLTTLDLSNCWKLVKLPDDFQSMQSLEFLHISSQKPINLRALTNFSSLRELYLGQFGDNDFPKNLHGLSSLEELQICWNYELIELPESISHLSGLKHLLIDSCSRLQTLHGLPPGIQALTVRHCESLEKIEDLSKEYKCLYKVELSDCPKLVEDEENGRYLDKMLNQSFLKSKEYKCLYKVDLTYCGKLVEDEENGRYLDKMLDQSFLKKCAAVDGCLMFHIPGSNIPSWIKEQEDGRKIALKLPPKWQTEIIGFVVCCVSGVMYEYPKIKLRFKNDEMLVSKLKANNINETEEADWNLLTAYIPFSLFEQFHGEGNDNDLEGEDWFHMTKGNLVFEISRYSGHVVRCGAKVVYKEDVASIQQTIPSISSIYWSWKLTNEFNNSFTCRE